MSEEGVERRLTTILAADVVGYSRLMAADEAGTLAWPRLKVGLPEDCRHSALKVSFRAESRRFFRGR